MSGVDPKNGSAAGQVLLLGGYGADGETVSTVSSASGLTTLHSLTGRWSTRNWAGYTSLTWTAWAVAPATTIESDKAIRAITEHDRPTSAYLYGLLRAHRGCLRGGPPLAISHSHNGRLPAEAVATVSAVASDAAALAAAL